ncbi:MAG TPA: serine/threonine-protein kinase [Vicinamibacterales bacterium]|nr:serine/threonine-protein kinase [Vicinamibacterales bacterium]
MTEPVSPAEAIFLALADLAPADRESLLQERCGQDSRLRAEVDAMLAAIEAPDDGFLDPARIPVLDMAAVDGPLQPGTVLGDFLVLHAIGSGGMGVVYAAQQDRPRRTVAIKVLRRGFRHPEILRRFEREAEVLGRLQHPGIANVFAFYRGDRHVPAHLVMELVSGPPITEYVQAQGLGHAARIELLIDVCQAVQHAHERGIIHRDLKPANVLVSDSGLPKVLDFGIARATGLDFHSTIQTAHGQLIGTLAYMSPERLRGGIEVDGRSDVYALGVMFYRLMAGRLPFDIGGLPLVEAAQRILHTDVPPLGSIDESFVGPIEQVARRAMAPDPDRRYQSAAELAADLRACLDGRAPSAAVSLDDDAASRAVSQVLAARSVDLRLIALVLVGGAVIVLDASTGMQLAAIPGDGTPIERLSFDADGRLEIRRTGSTIERVPIRFS